MKNVVLITADSLRFDHLSYLDDESSQTPHIDQYAKEGCFFNNAIATGSGTSTSFPGILASSLPMDFGYKGLNANHESLAKVLSSQDVRTIGISSSPHVSSLYGYDQGFDVFFDDPELEDNLISKVSNRMKDIGKEIPILGNVGKKAFDIKAGINGPDKPYIPADELTEVALQKVSRDVEEFPDKKHFIWIHYMEPHNPPYIPDEYIEKYHGGTFSLLDVQKLWQRWQKERAPLWHSEIEKDNSEIFSKDEKEALQQYYKAQVNFLDKQVANLISGFEQINLSSETRTIFTSDHGEEFFDHGDLGHRQKLYEELIHVPLVIFEPLSEYGESVNTDKLISLLDLAPSIAEWLGVNSRDKWRGKPVQPVKDENECREFAISEICHTGDEGFGGDVKPDQAVVSIRSAKWKYILNEQKGTKELFNLDKDNEELKNVYGEHTEIAERLESTALNRISEVTEQDVSSNVVSDDVKDRLAQLGYKER